MITSKSPGIHPHRCHAEPRSNSRDRTQNTQRLKKKKKKKNPTQANHRDEGIPRQTLPFGPLPIVFDPELLYSSHFVEFRYYSCSSRVVRSGVDSLHWPYALLIIIIILFSPLHYRSVLPAVRWCLRRVTAYRVQIAWDSRRSHHNKHVDHTRAVWPIPVTCWTRFRGGLRVCSFEASCHYFYCHVRKSWRGVITCFDWCLRQLKRGPEANEQKVRFGRQA